uniref:Uncharacterized protein n=1 Tax=Meloidogyne enterolobii TaxID=390850 RepID=A0A6V7VUZ8_MELEN|nr:unnamed protein product [Meloidogyne enterolobii]
MEAKNVKIFLITQMRNENFPQNTIKIMLTKGKADNGVEYIQNS